jgi:hypothetical protein
VWLSFTVAVVLFGVVAVLATGGTPAEPAGWWVAALAVVSVLCLTTAEVFGRRPLDCRDLASLAAGYRNRFFLRMACSEAIALFAFVATFIVGQGWIYWLFLPFTLYGFGRNARPPGISAPSWREPHRTLRRRDRDRCRRGAPLHRRRD